MPNGASGETPTLVRAPPTVSGVVARRSVRPYRGRAAQTEDVVEVVPVRFDVNGEVLASLVIGLAALGSLAFGIYQFIDRRRQESVAAILEGSKESGATAALRFRDHPERYRFRPGRRRELVTALCLAAVFKSSGRTRALIHEALASRMRSPKYAPEIRRIVDHLTRVVGRSGGYTELDTAHRRIRGLRAALGMDGDLRTRLSAIELSTGEAMSGEAPCPCGHEAHRWTNLRAPIAELGQLVLVCTDTGSPLIALGHHRSPTSEKTDRPLSEVGMWVVKGKYRGSPTVREPLELLCDDLATVVRANHSYGAATRVAAVPGTTRFFSDAMGRRLSEILGLELVRITRSPDASSRSGVRLTVDGDVSGTAAVILVDDVYRSGKAFRRAAEALRKAGAREVLGLAATCAVSPTEVNASDEELGGSSVEPATK